MKIAIIVRRLNVTGGTQKLAAQLARKMRERGHEVIFYTFSYSKDKCYPEILGDFTVIEPDEQYVQKMRETGGVRGPVAFFKNYYYENRAARNLALKILPDMDILNPHDQLGYRISRYFRKIVKNIPSVWIVNDVSTKKASLIRNVQFDPSAQVSFLRKIFYWLVDKFEYMWFVRFQDVILVLDERNKRLAREAFPAVDVVIARGGLDKNEFPYRERTSIDIKEVHLLMFAILMPHRRFEDGITAISMLKEQGINTTLSIVGATGDTKYYQTLISLVTKLHLEDRIHFKGRIPYNDLLNEYQKADIFLFPCHLQTWGLVVFEAMASGLPTIVSETSGASDVLENNKNAMIVPPYSPQSIAKAVEQLSKNPDLYRSMSQEGRKFVEQNISWDTYSEQVIEIFKATLTIYAK